MADSPIRCGRAPPAVNTRSSSRAKVSARCDPRLSSTSAWISSTITVLVRRSASRPRSAVSRMNSDSGVVTRMCGGRRIIRSRSQAEVSPVRTAVRTPGLGNPWEAAIVSISASGVSRFLPMSLLSALSGDTYTTSIRSSRRPSSPTATNRSRQMRNAARVLPDPVGADTRTSRPARILGHASRCGGVAAANRPRNHSAISG